jgi:hypothetical protein
MIWNPRSGGGKALAANLADEARACGVELIELTPGDDLAQMVREAVAGGADGMEVRALEFKLPVARTSRTDVGRWRRRCFPCLAAAVGGAPMVALSWRFC